MSAAAGPTAIEVPRARAGGVRHTAGVVAGFTLLFVWIFARPILEGTYLSESDLFDYYLPVFLAPPAVWSGFEFAGLPAFADPESSTFYPPHLIARLAGSWTLFVVSAYVLAACFMYAYVHHHTRSRSAAALSGAAYALSEAMLERLPHPNVLHVLAWLPLLLLALDRVRARDGRWLWAGIGAVAAASCVLAGHPQMPVYVAYLCGAYAVAGALADRWPRGAWAALAVMGIVATLLAGVILLPLAEVSRYMARQTVPFEEFVSYSNTPAEMLSIFFPTIAHIGREAPTYVGLGVLMLAAAAARRHGPWRVTFWLAVAAVALLLGAGDATPLARLVYELPLQDRFRIVARHLTLGAFALAALGGFGLAAIERGRVSRRQITAAVGGVLAAMLAAGVVVAVRPAAFGYERVNEDLALPLWNSGIWAQFGIVLVTAAAVAAAWRVRSAVSRGLLLAVVSADLVLAVPGAPSIRGLPFETVPEQALVPGVHAVRLRTALLEDRQRLFAPGGAHAGDIVPAMFARVWQIPTMNSGYSSVLLDGLATLAMIPQWRSGDRTVLADRNVALDVLAVRYALFREDALTAEERALLAEPGRWREVARVSTSRTSDRTRDEDVPGEAAYVVYENLRALPRAWLAREVLPVTDGGLVDALFGSRLREGRRFDPAQVVLADEGQLPARIYPEGPRDVRVETIEDGRIVLHVSSGAGGFLVLSEPYYPGWQVHIDDGPPRPADRVDMALQGTAVPPGDHRVVFELASRTRRLGMAASAAGLLAVAGLLIAAAIRHTPAGRLPPA